MIAEHPWLRRSVILLAAGILAFTTGPLAGEPVYSPSERHGMTDIEARHKVIIGSPPRIAPLGSDEMSEEAQEITKRIRDAAGAQATSEVPEYVATMLRHPGLYERHVALGTELLGNGTLSARHRELAVLRTGWLCGAPYEWGEHVAIAKRSDLTSAEIDRATRGSTAQGWSDEERAILRATEELHENAMISDVTWEKLEAFLDERQLIELPYVIGTYTKVAYLQNSLRLRLTRTNPGLFAR